MDEAADYSKHNYMLTFFSKPAVGIAGSIASIIGIVLSIYFFSVSREKPELTYFVHPAKAAVLRIGQTSQLSVRFNGQDLAENVTATQIAFWNAGNKAIRASSILSPLVIKTGNKARILEAKLRKTSRDVVHIAIDSSRLGFGEVAIGWSILEHNDGGVLQIVYAGDETVDIQGHAVLEEQPELVRLKYGRELRTPGEQYTRLRGIGSQLPGYLMIIGGIMIILASVLMITKKRRQGRKLWLSNWWLLTQGPCMIGFGIWILLTQRPPGPPFGF